MAISGIPEVIHDFNIYNGGSKLVGVSGEVTLPDFEAMTETISGPGILGEIETIIPGRYGSMEMEIPFRVVNTEFFSMINPGSSAALTLRGTIQYNVKSTGAPDYMGMRVVVRGRCKKIALGTLKQGGAMDSSVSLELTYILIELDGKKAIELDKLNGKFVVNNTDLLAKVRKYT